MRRAIGTMFFVFTIFGGAVVAGAQPSGPRLRAPPPDPEVVAPERPVFSDVHELDYESLPTMTDASFVSNDETHFEIYAEPQDPHEMPTPPTWDVAFANPISLLRLNGRILPEHRLDGYLPPAPGPSEWYVLGWDHMTASSLPLRRLEGAFDGHFARATNAGAVKAASVVDGRVYAYRRCVAGCDTPIEDPDREEQLALIAPPGAVWLESSDDAGGRNAVERTWFTTVSATAKPGVSTTLGVVMPNDRTGVLLPRTRPSKAAGLAVQVDVLWPTGEGPELVVSTGEVSGSVEALGWHGRLELRHRARDREANADANQTPAAPRQ